MSEQFSSDTPTDKLRLRGTLEMLPHEVKSDMEEQMRQIGVAAAFKYTVEKYGTKYPNVAKLNKQSFYRYYTRHRIDIAKELELQKKSAPPPPEILGVIEAITSPVISLEDKKQALIALYDSCKARSELLERRNDSYIDPQLEALILANRKEQRTIIEKVTILSDHLSKESDKDFIQEMMTLVQVILSTVYNSYKIVNGNNNFSLFSSTVEEALKVTMQSYRTEKEKLLQQPPLHFNP